MQLRLPLSPAPAVEPEPPAKVVFVRHRWARRYIIRVLSDGTVRVTLPARGAKRDALAFLEKSQAWVARRRADLRAEQSPAREAADVARFRAQARRDLPPRLLALAAQHGLTVTRVSVLDQQSRWGACSRRGRITLNWRLVLVPDFVRDYVMLHELMHLREMNHSRRFWRHVAAVCPRYLEARRWLLDQGRRLF